MAKAKKTDKSNIDTPKAASIFDLLSYLTDKKVPWTSLSEADKKAFSPYMVNRFLSMNMDYIELVNELQKYTVGVLEPKATYMLFYDLLPAVKNYNKYIKGSKESKFNPELVVLIAKHFSISRQDAMEYLDMFFDNRLDSLKEIIKKYAKSDKDIEKLLKYEKD